MQNMLMNLARLCTGMQLIYELQVFGVLWGIEQDVSFRSVALGDVKRSCLSDFLSVTDSNWNS